jgi:catechol 2,3-dioxygenase-like lactoylglutathione lyase family enzyme
VAARIDHVVLGVRNQEAAARRLRSEFGLASVAGGRHEAWGTGNLIVPLGSSYVEILGVVEPEKAAGSVLGCRLLSSIEDGDRLMGWCVAVEDIDQAAGRLGLAPAEGSRVRPDGATLRWRSVGMEEALADPSRPFFISWLVPDDLHPGRTPVAHSTAPTGLAWVEVTGTASSIRAWLGPEGRGLPVRIRTGTPSLVAAGISTASGAEIVVR